MNRKTQKWSVFFKTQVWSSQTKSKETKLYKKGTRPVSSYYRKSVVFVSSSLRLLLRLLLCLLLCLLLLLVILLVLCHVFVLVLNRLAHAQMMMGDDQLSPPGQSCATNSPSRNCSCSLSSNLMAHGLDPPGTGPRYLLVTLAWMKMRTTINGAYFLNIKIPVFPFYISEFALYFGKAMWGNIGNAFV